MSRAETALQIKGWRVIRAEWTEKTRHLGTPKWKALSRVFTVRSAAEKYAELARREPEVEADDIQVETVYL